MTQSTINQIIAMTGGARITGFFLVLARVSPLFVLAPLFSSKMLPAKVKGIVAIALSLGMTGIATHGQHIPTAPLDVAGLMAKELLIGAAFAFAIGAVLAVIQAAGAFTDLASGFGFAALVDPSSGNQGGVITQVYSLVGLMVFLAIGGDAWMLRGLKRTFDLVPLTKSPQLTSLTQGALQIFTTIFTSALELAAPALLALAITDVALGMVARVVPQLNIFAVGFPLKIGIGLLVVSATMPFLGGWLTDQLTTSVGVALHSLRIA
jgi:flagellar biosynthesis protein FliR